MRRTLTLILVVTLVVPLAGCFAPGGAAEVPDAALRSKGWKKAGGQDGSAAASLVTYHLREYAPGSVFGSNFGRVVVVTTPDVPLVNEGRFVDKELEKIAAREGIELKNPRENAITLASGVEAAQVVYDVQKSGIGSAKLRKVTWECGGSNAFIAAIGYGVVGGTFEDSGDLVKAVGCP